MRNLIRKLVEIFHVLLYLILYCQIETALK